MNGQLVSVDEETANAICATRWPLWGPTLVVLGYHPYIEAVTEHGGGQVAILTTTGRVVFGEKYGPDGYEVGKDEWYLATMNQEVAK